MSNKRRLLLRCRLTRPFLGARRTKDGIRVFDINVINNKKYLEVDTIQWRWALREAFDSLGLVPEVDLDYVRLPADILSPTIRTYSRAWNPKNPVCRETFECYQAGTVITFPIFILGELEQKSFNGISITASRPPTREEIEKSFSIIGESIGLSPWGSKFGYGRFIVESIE